MPRPFPRVGPIRTTTYALLSCRTPGAYRSGPGPRMLRPSYQNSFGVGSNKCALRASNSFSNRRDSSKISGFRNVKYRRCVCRTCATNRTYSSICSGVIFAKFSICGHFDAPEYKLSIFLFRLIYGPFYGLARRTSSFPLFLCTRFRFFGYTSRFFDRLFGNGVVAPKERSGSCSIIIRAKSAKIVVYLVMITERARPRNGCENLRRHITVILRRSNRKRVV